MEGKSKLLAVLAVAVMMGCALAPFAYAGDDAAAETEEADEFPLSALIESIKEMKDDIKELRLGDVVLVPSFDSEEKITTVLDKEIKTSVTIGSGDSKELGNTYNTDSYKFTEAGKINVLDGGELVIFDGGKKQQQELTIVDGRDTTPLNKDTVISMEKGSKLTIFGFTFEVLTGFDLVTFMRNYQSTDAMSVTFRYSIGLTEDKGENYVDFSMKVKEDYTVVTLANAVSFYGLLSGQKGDYDFRITGNSEHSLNADDRTFTYSFSEGKIELNVRQGSYLTTGSVDVPGSLSVYLNRSDDGKTITAKASIDNTININLATTHGSAVITMANAAFALKNLVVTHSLLDSDGSHYKISATCDEISFVIGSLVYMMTDGKTVTTASATGMGIRLAGFEMIIDVSSGKVEDVSKLKGSFEATLGEIKASIVYEGGSVTWDQTFARNVKFSIVNFVADEIEGKFGVDSIALTGTVTRSFLFTHDLEIAGTVSDLSGTAKEGKMTITCNAELLISTTYDGIRRDMSVTAQGVSISESTGVTIGEMAILNELPAKVLDLGIPTHSEMHIYDIAVGEEFVADRAHFVMGENGIFDGAYADLDGNVKISVEPNIGHIEMRFACDYIFGYFMNVDGYETPFYILDGADFEIETNVFGGADLFIYKGDAMFGDGMLPFNIYVSSGVEFRAEGLTAYRFSFENMADTSGWACIDTGFLPGYEAAIEYGDDFSITLKTYDGCDGYKMTMNLDTMRSGTLEAKTGCLLPSTYSNDGFSMKSADGKNGTFTADGKSDVRLKTEKEGFTLSYEDDAAPESSHKYGEVFKIEAVGPEKEGYEFIGWTDGTGNVYRPGDYYTMPAKDVKMSPLYAGDATVTVVTEGDKKVAVIDGDEADIVSIDVPEGGYDAIRVTTGRTTVEMSKETYDNMIHAKVFEIQQLYLVTTKVSSYEGGDTLYSVKIVEEDGTEAEYSGGTDFKVTLNVFAGTGAQNFDVDYVDEYGHRNDMYVESWKNVGNGYYEVTFKTNHFSNFLVSYDYEHSIDNTMVAVIGIAVALILVAGILMTFYVKGEAKKKQ